MEIDNDNYGRGDWLIWGLVPPNIKWTTDGIQVSQDTNNDVGYDSLVFDVGIGLDPAAVWIRRSPSSLTRIKFAFKQTSIAPPCQFLWGVWADEGPINPVRFDYKDHYSLSQAGSPITNTSNYPLKELAMVNNSCRWGCGYTPTNTNPCVCRVTPKPAVSIYPSPTHPSSPKPIMLNQEPRLFSLVQ